MAFVAGVLYGILFYRGSPTTWHWGLFMPHHTSQTLTTTGTLFHCSNDARTNGIWAYEARQGYNPGSAQTGNAIVLVVQLADLRHLGGGQELSRTLNSCLKYTRVVPNAGLRNPTFDCKIWFFEAMRELEGIAIVTCPSLSKLEQELNMTALQATQEFLRTSRHAFVVATRCSA